MEKAVEIKRRAQRCVQNGDLDGALNEYEKLVASDGADPYNYVLIADLLYKKGDQQAAGERYLTAAESYEGAGLYKNGIAVCKKMLRLSLASGTVLRRLGSLHAGAGLGAEASLYFIQYAEQMVRANENDAAAEAFTKAYEASPENAKPLERAAEALVLEDRVQDAAQLLMRAAEGHAKQGQVDAAEDCRRRAQDLDPTVAEESASNGAAAEPSQAASAAVPEPGVVDESPTTNGPQAEPAAEVAPADGQPTRDVEPASAASEIAGVQAPADEVPPEPTSNAPDEVTAIESAWGEAGASSGAPGLDFEGPGKGAREVSDVEAILAEAQEHFKSGDRDAAAGALARAALAYEEAGNHDNAATIYRSLGKSAQVSPEVLNHWFENCRHRGDRIEAAQVACEIGDRCMVNGDRVEAQHWFEKAIGLDESNELASRRLERLSGKAPGAAQKAAVVLEEEAPVAEAVEVDEDELLGPEDAAAANGEPKKGSEAEPGRVELAVGRGEAVTFDLGSLISEFQRGVDAQLSDDAQSHYDLAMAYREMGLLEQALDSFRIAANDPAYSDRCAEMIGRCLLDQGRFEEAVQEFDSALKTGSADTDTQVSLRYQLGLAYEAAGRVQEALTEFEGVYVAQPNYPDVALKIRVLRKSLESI